MPDVVRRPRPTPAALVAAAKILNPTSYRASATDIQYAGWQDEAWAFYRAEGELWYGVTWLAQGVSRVKLTAAVEQPGGAEPEPLDDGMVAELVGDLGGGPGGQAGLLKMMTIHLSVPGKTWLLGEDINSDFRKWCVKSANELRATGRPEAPYEVLADENLWKPVAESSLVVPIWDPDPQYSYRATSPVRAALSCLRKIDLYNRTIVSKLVSRMALNGILFIPSEATFPVKDEFKEAPDPFVAELVDIAATAIKNPGDARSAIPLPLKVKSELIEKFRYLKIFESEEFRELIDSRDRELVRLANMLNLPAEVLTGMGDVNHWTAWQLSEDAARVHIAPIVELICSGLTAGYLQPSLLANNSSLTDSTGRRYVVWYDLSEIVTKPDRTAQAQDGADRIFISAKSYRRETGWDESDAPTPAERREQVLLQAVRSGTPEVAKIAFTELTGIEVPDHEHPVAGASDAEPGGPSDGSGNEDPPPSKPAPATGPPPTQGQPPPTPGA